MQILELWRFPIKGFGGSQVETATLATDGYFPYDRHFAISTGGQKIATAGNGAWFPKAHFLQLMSHEALAKYSCRYLTDGAKPVLELFHQGKSCISINPNSDHGQRQFEDFITSNFMIINGLHLFIIEQPLAASSFSFMVIFSRLLVLMVHQIYS